MHENKLSLMVQGHEIWLEKNGNGSAQLSIMFGHNMHRDGAVDIKRLMANVFDQNGGKVDAELLSGQDSNTLEFKAAKDGFYTAFVDMGVTIWSVNKDGYKEGPKFKYKDVTYSGAFHQMAKYIVAVGKAGEYKSSPLHGILEIIPKEPNFQVGSDALLTVMYEDKPLVGVEVKAVSKNEGKEMALVKTDRSGSVRIPITVAGEWMFLARYNDSSKKVNEEFDESVFINTLVMEAR
ncbi:MAG: DUF4198 domain-containing protein [Methanothrix sp.]|nr:DUF4198 domain-containing protein [Methanothrix sp.]